MMAKPARRSRRIAALVATAVAAVVLAACTTPSGGPGSSHGGAAPDDGTTLTLWTRNQGDKRLADLYNKTHKNKVKVTVVPSDTFLQKVGAAAGSGSLPDILVSDVVYAVNYATQGVYADITDRVDGLKYKNDLVQAHLKAATVKNRIYAVPHDVDVSMLFYNKKLFREAGLDPEKFPTSFGELYKAAAAIHAHQPGAYGMVLSNTPGGWAYQAMASLAASGQPPIKNGGRTVNLDTDAMRETLTFYKRMLAEGIMPATTRSDLDVGTDPLMINGRAGMGWAGNWFGGGFGKDIHFDWGVAPWPAIQGGHVGGFVGGDVQGVTARSKHYGQAWNFIEWTYSNEAEQLLGKEGALPTRTDLINEPTWANMPDFAQMMQAVKNGYTPSSLPYGEIFNVPTGPWFRGIEAALFDGADIDKTLATMQQQAQKIVDNAYANQ